MFDFNKDPGAGNLSMRAYFASIVGPRRIAHGRRSVKRVPINEALRLVDQVSGLEVMYFEIWLPQSTLAALPGSGAYFSFSSSETAGQNGFQILLSPTQRYQGVLLPDDALYAQAVSDALFAPLANDVSVVVAAVVF